MKLRVVGWVYYDEDIPQGEKTWAARSAIVDDIKKNGYMFSGMAHQECLDCAPVLNDGKLYCYSQRGWGDIMAEAYDHTDYMSYALYAWDYRIKSEEIRPKGGFDYDGYIPESDLSERFELEAEKEFFDTLARKRKIKLDDLPELRYLAPGDTLAFTCGDSSIEFTVSDVDRMRDLTDKKRIRLLIAMRDFSDDEKKKRATDEFNNTKVVIIVSVKKPKIK